MGLHHWSSTTETAAIAATEATATAVSATTTADGNYITYQTYAPKSLDFAP